MTEEEIQITVYARPLALGMGSCMHGRAVLPLRFRRGRILPVLGCLVADKKKRGEVKGKGRREMGPTEDPARERQNRGEQEEGHTKEEGNHELLDEQHLIADTFL